MSLVCLRNIESNVSCLVTRTAKMSFFQGYPSVAIVASTLAVSVVGFAIPYVPPLAKALNIVRPAGAFIGVLVAFFVLYTIVWQLANIMYIGYGNDGCSHPSAARRTRLYSRYLPSLPRTHDEESGNIKSYLCRHSLFSP
ncbi:hypothetical protein BKA65DRAFT_502947 [Rhexocercosporidium sp. MPI-PUGE-AT-0058]|nr:hypothetical protein BKA65DRAFT_502947 [Rhexocercosporidium sp. MPI-PUGE-AT-0058]